MYMRLLLPAVITEYMTVIIMQMPLSASLQWHCGFPYLCIFFSSSYMYALLYCHTFVPQPPDHKQKIICP